MFLMLAGTVFHSYGPATKNDLPPYFVLVRGRFNLFVVAERSRRRPCITAIVVVVSDRYAGLVPLLTPCIRTQFESYPIEDRQPVVRLHNKAGIGSRRYNDYKMILCKCVRPVGESHKKGLIYDRYYFTKV